MAAAAGADWAKAPGFYMILTDSAGAQGLADLGRHLHPAAEAAEGSGGSRRKR